MISIIIPVYNTPTEYLRQCIHSILKQKYKDIEILLIDDGSNDECRCFLCELQKLDYRIRLLPKDNGGVSLARNYGLQYATGEYIAFVDSDDWVSDKYLEEALLLLEKYQLDLVIGNMKTFDFEENKPEPSLVADLSINKERAVASRTWIISGEKLSLLKKSIISCEPEQFLHLKGYHHIGGVHCRLFRKEAIKGCSFTEGLAIAEDSLFNLKVLLRAERVGIVSNIWYHYRVHNTSATKRFRDALPMELYQVLMNFKNFIEDSNSEYNSAFCTRVIKEYTTLMKKYVFHPQSELSISQRLKFIKATLQDYISELLRIKTNMAELKLKHIFLISILRLKLTPIIYIIYRLKYY